MCAHHSDLVYQTKTKKKRQMCLCFLTPGLVLGLFVKFLGVVRL